MKREATILLTIAAFLMLSIHTSGQTLLLPSPPGYVRGTGDCENVLIGAVGDHWRVSKGGRMRFWAVQQLDRYNDLEFHWAVTNGQILRGQGTWTIEVKAGKQRTPGYVNASGFVQVRLMVTRRKSDSTCSVEAKNTVMIGRHVESIAQVYDLAVSHDELKFSCRSEPSLTPATSVEIRSIATHPYFDPLTYTYFVEVGRIIGDGPNVTWDLTDAPTGTYKITAGVEDPLCGVCRNTVTRIVRVVACDSELSP